MSAPEPTRDQLDAMAYVDGELDAVARARFEARLDSEPSLLREVAELDRLGVLARQMTPREPKDFEWQRLEGEILHSGGMSLGLVASAVGAVGTIGWLGYRLAVSELEAVPKICLGLLLGGALLVFLLVFRARIRTAPYDPYREVER